jgi:hypothetical protein
MIDEERIASLESRVAELEKVVERGVDEMTALLRKYADDDTRRNAVVTAQLETIYAELERRLGVTPDRKPSLQ